MRHHQVVIAPVHAAGSSREHLAETIAWCQPRTSSSRVRDCFRSPNLQPRILQSGYREALGSVVSARRHHVRGAVLPPDPLADGRLLAYFPDADLACGTAEAESSGYFDVHNCPPWDTWVLLTEQPTNPDASYATCLITWVPQELLAHAQRGIDVNPEDCIRWFEDCPPGVHLVVRHVLSL